MLKMPSFDMNTRPCAFQRIHYRTPIIQDGGDPHYGRVLRARHIAPPPTEKSNYAMDTKCLRQLSFL